MGFTIKLVTVLIPAVALASLHEIQGSALNIAVFQSVDLDKSSFIEENEGLSGFDAWQEYDADKDGKLSLREFSRLAHEAQRLEEASLLQEKAKRVKSSARARCLPGSPKDIFMFQIADKDKNGFIEKSEGLSDFDFSAFDNDKDGKLSPKEFMILVQESLRLEDEGPELKDEEHRFSVPINRHDASLSEGLNVMQGRAPKANDAGLNQKANGAGVSEQPGVDRPPDISPEDITKDIQLPLELTAFETDHWNDLSEYFGPFRLDYASHTIEVPGWNLIVESRTYSPGRGNLVIGNQNFYNDADNSLLSGKHHTARGRQISVVGGKDDVAEGQGIVIMGGEQNTARGNYTVVDGGYRNEADSSYSVVEGGVKNAADGVFASISGGQENLALGYSSSITGGKANEIMSMGKYAAVHGGVGNKLKGNYSTIGGGVGQNTAQEVEFEALFVPLSDEDRETVADPDHVGQHFTS